MTAYISHPDITGDPVPVPDSALPHWLSCGWEQVEAPPRRSRAPRPTKTGPPLTTDTTSGDQVPVPVETVPDAKADQPTAPSPRRARTGTAARSPQED